MKCEMNGVNSGKFMDYDNIDWIIFNSPHFPTMIKHQRQYLESSTKSRMNEIGVYMNKIMFMYT